MDLSDRKPTFNIKKELLDSNELALVATDIHLVPSELELGKSVLEKIERTIDELKPKYFINCGDTYHTKNITHVTVINLYENFVKRIAKKCKVIHIIGNHDWGLEYSEHPFNALKLVENVVVVEDVFTLNKTAFISYCREKERFQEMLLRAGKGIERIFCHIDLTGFTPGSGWEEISPFFDAEFFSNFKQIVSGHLHLAQEKVLKSGTEIIFVGSFNTHDFGESDQKKRMLTIDLDTGVWDEIPTEMCLHKTFRISVKDPYPEIPEAEVFAGVNFRVIIKGLEEEVLLKMKEKPRNYPAKVIDDITRSDKARVELKTTDTKEETLKKYIESELDRSYKDVKENYDVEQLLKEGKKFLENL